VCRPLDDLSFFVDDEVKGPVRVKERQSVPSGVLAGAALAHTRDFSVAHQGLDERRLNPEGGSDDISIHFGWRTRCLPRRTRLPR
jgi:hypothetical protein